MPNVSSCPACHREITLPAELAPERRLRCPLCNAAFLAEAVLANSIPAPPEVIVDATACPAGIASESVPAETEMAAPAGAPGPLETTEMADHTAQGDAPDQTSLRDAPQWEAARDELAPAEEQGVAGEWTSKDWTAGDETASAPATAAEAETGTEATTADEETEAGAAAPGEPSSDNGLPAYQQGASFEIAASPRPKASSGGGFGQFAGMVAGGVIGLTLGYLVLLWIGGAQADFLKVRKYLPRWVLPRERGESRSSRDASQLLPPNPWTRPMTAAAGQAGDAPRGAGAPDPAVILASVTADSPNPSAAPAPSARTIWPQGAGAPVPKADDAASLGPLQYVARTPDELAAAVSQIGEALGCEHCGGRGIVLQGAIVSADSRSRRSEPLSARRARCEYCDGRPSGSLTPALFEQLCDLADIVTFTRLDASQTNWNELRGEAQRVLFRIGGEHHKAQIAGRLAGPRLDDSRRQSNGILLAGTVHDAGDEGRLYAMRLVLFGVPRTVTVMSFHAPTPPLAPRDRVILFGSIIDSPRDNLGGYEGEQLQVVWGGLALRIE